MPIEDLDIDVLPRLKIVFEANNMYRGETMVRTLINLCSANVNFEDRPDLVSCKLIVDGTPNSEDVEHAALQIAPDIFNYLDNTPRWESGILGIMQLILISQISYTLKSRSSS